MVRPETRRREMKVARMFAVALLGLTTAACSDDGGNGGSGGSSGSAGSGGSGASCSGVAELTDSPSAAPTSAAPGDTVTVTVPVNAPTTLVKVQLQSATDGAGYGDGESSATGAGDVDVSVTVDTAAPAGTMYPFVQVYECGETTVSTQYAPDFGSGAYMTYRSDDPGSATPSGFTAPAITIQ
jgi:hypothetical protein